MYTHSLWGTHSRREHLFNAKKFWCECPRCGDPTEFGTDFSTLVREGKKLRRKDPLDQVRGEDPAGENVSFLAEILRKLIEIICACCATSFCANCKRKIENMR